MKQSSIPGWWRKYSTRKCTPDRKRSEQRIGTARGRERGKLTVRKVSSVLILAALSVEELDLVGRFGVFAGASHVLGEHSPNCDTVRYLVSSVTGAANAFSNVMDIAVPFRTLFTNAGLKQTMHVPTLCRTLG